MVIRANSLILLKILKLDILGYIRMERLLSVLDGEAKYTNTSIGRNRIFYAATLMTLKRNFGNPQLVTLLK